MPRSGSPTRCGPISAAATCSKGSSPTRNAIGGLAASPRRCPPACASHPLTPMTRDPSGVLLGVALAVSALAFHEYERIASRIGAQIPYWTALLATLLACAMVPFEWID